MTEFLELIGGDEIFELFYDNWSFYLNVYSFIFVMKLTRKGGKYILVI
jgi:hypothetical protein